MRKTKEYTVCDLCMESRGSMVEVSTIGRCLACGKDVCANHGGKHKGPTAGGNGPLLLASEFMLCKTCALELPPRISEIIADAYDEILMYLRESLKSKC